MEFSALLQIISVIIECAVIVLALRIAVSGKRIYGWLIAVTFTLYVVFDLSRFGIIPFPEDIPSFIFFLASFSALVAVFLILRDVTGATIRAIDREWL